MGGAMDLVRGARRVIVAMTHTARGRPKIVEACSLPLTSQRRLDLVVTELAVLEPSPAGLVLKELAPGVGLEAVQRATATRLLVREPVPTMRILVPA
jgi:acetate CoA/acetoacetate CoA-transferase beta subunit